VSPLPAISGNQRGTTATAVPYPSGAPPEGPLSFIARLTIPAGTLQGTASIDVSQFGLSQVTSALVNNQTNITAISVQFGAAALILQISALTAQMLPIYTTGKTVFINVTLATVQAVDCTIQFQFFNTIQPTASYSTVLQVSGNVTLTASSVNAFITNSTVNIFGIVSQSGVWSVQATQSGVWAVGQSGAWNVTLLNALLQAQDTGQNCAYGQVAVATTATLIAAARAARRELHIRSSVAGQIWIGGDNAVTAANGYPLGANPPPMKSSGALYGIAPTGPLALGYMEFY
jgi:hypothetical protein